MDSLPTTTPFAIGLLTMTFIAAGNGLFQPTQSTLITTEARLNNLDVRTVMGARGIWCTIRIIGPILAAFIWAATVDGIGLWTYHTVFELQDSSLYSVSLSNGVSKGLK